MSATGFDVSDSTLQSTNIWLDEIMATLGPDRQVAWRVLAAVLHTLRDRFQTGLAVHLGAQRPRHARHLKERHQLKPRQTGTRMSRRRGPRLPEQ
jgi:uncharacterized protein (DUF2267 family)